MGKETGFLIAVQTRDRDGCRDESEDRDDDNDGVPDNIDLNSLMIILRQVILIMMIMTA